MKNHDKINQDLLQRLHQNKIINQEFVLWWQLGFEGRRVFSEEEFEEGLEEVSYRVEYPDTEDPNFEPHVKTYQIWNRDEVPIVLKNINLFGEEISCFISVKPLSHDDGGGDGWHSLKCCKEFGSPLSVYHSPHIRGLAIQETDDFLFWHPFLSGDSSSYQTSVFRRYEDEGKLPILLSPINPSKFCYNLIKNVWQGKRSQKKAKELTLKHSNHRFVPYYNFDHAKDHITIYPAQIFKGKLDLPVIVVGSKETQMPSILGTGYASSEGGHFWELNSPLYERARDSLIKRLGHIK
jgi:hypothetical protein